MNASLERENKLSLSLTLRLFLPFALGYFLSQHFRAVNALISDDLVRDTGIDAFQLGTVTGVYFLAFAVAQIPLGILLDKIGPRRTEAGLLVFAALGAALFGSAMGLEQLILGRLLIGIGVSCCLVAAFKAFVMWLPSHQIPFANGCLMAAGSLGILAATIPLEATLNVIDWRGVFYGLAILTLVTAGLVFFFIPDKKVDSQGESLRSQVMGLTHVLRSGYFWRIVPLVMVLEGGVAGLYTLWAAPWLRDMAGFNSSQVANALFLMAVAMLIGYPAFGYMTSRLNRVGISTMGIAVTGMSLAIVSGAVVLFQLTDNVVMSWATMMFFSTSSILVFAAMGQHYPRRLSGRVMTALNFMLFMSAFLIQSGIGAILNRYAVPAGSVGYSPAGYHMVALIYVTAQVLGLAWFFISGRFLGKNEDFLNGQEKIDGQGTEQLQ